MAQNWLTPSQLDKARGCERYGALSMLHLGQEKNPDEEAKSEGRKVLARCLSCESLEEAEALWTKFMEEDYPHLSSEIMREAGGLLDTKARRYLRWFFENGYTVVDPGGSYSFDLNEDLQVSGTVDAVIQDHDGRKVCVVIKNGKTEYTDKARKAENKAENCIEALCMMAYAKKCGAELCQLHYLSAKDESSRNLNDVFEKKPGKNVVSLKTDPGYLKKLAEALTLKKEASCEDCKKAALCKTKGIVLAKATTEVKRKTVSGYDSLSNAQKKAVDTVEGPLLLVSGPGGGKTHVITQRALKLMKDCKVKGSKILIMSYTNKACDEDRERIASQSGNLEQPLVSTIHSACAYIIRNEKEDAVDKKLATPLNQKELVMRALLSEKTVEGVSYDGATGTFGIINRMLSWVKQIDEGIELCPAPPDYDGVMAVYERFKKLYEEENYFTYEELILEATRLLTIPRIAKKYRDMWDYIMVDEYQDCTKSQHEFIHALAAPKNNLMVVGDPNQTINGFAGGTSEFLMDFKNEYPDAKVVTMRNNYRTTKKILETANEIVKGIFIKEEMLPTSALDEGYPIYYADNYNEEALVEFMKSQKNFDPSEICILARKNSTLDKIAAVFEENGLKTLPSRCYLRTTEEFGLLKCFLEYAEHEDRTPTEYLYRLLTYIGRQPDEVKDLYVRNFVETIPPTVKAALNLLDEEEEIDKLILGLWRKLTGAKKETAAVRELADKLRTEEVEDWREALFLMEDMEYYEDETEIEYAPRKGYFNLLTIHKAKGKEFPFVILYGVEDIDLTDEGKCLAYVALTRAMKVCVILKTSLEEAPVYDLIKERLKNLVVRAKNAKEDKNNSDVKGGGDT